MPAPATAVKTRMQPLNVNTTKGGEIVRYVPPPTTPAPQVINPQPIGTYSKPAPLPIPKNAKPDVIDAEVVPNKPAPKPTPPPRRPVVGTDARPYTQTGSQSSHPNVPNPLQAWKTLADYEAWRNGASQEEIDVQRDAYEFTRDWGRTGGMLYPYTENGPRLRIGSENLYNANQYRTRHGLPAIDAYGQEKPAPFNPSVQPGAGFSSNPFKTALDNVPGFPATPANFPDRRQSSDIDPDTGLPYTPLQRQRGNDLGRPPWHINPETGNPWGSDEPGVPLPLPFDGAPGGAVRFPAPNLNPRPTGLGVWTIRAYAQYGNGATSEVQEYQFQGKDSDVFSRNNNGTGWDLLKNGAVVIANYTLNSNSGTLIFSGSFRPDIVVDPSPGGDPTFEPIGKPSQPLPPSDPRARVSPTASPAPQPDARSNPTKPTPQPINPSGKPTDSPYTPAPVRSPVPQPTRNPLPSTPNLPTYSPNPAPYPRTGPNGSPSPSPDPQARPEPARPQNPAATETIDRPQKPPVNPCPCPGSGSVCPDPCPPEELQTISYKKFKGCLLLPNGAPDRFETASLSVPKNAAPAIKSMLESLADIQAQECTPCCYWDIDKGNPKTLWAGIPNIIGQEFVIAKGITRINVTFNAIEALSDNTLRSLKRIAADGNPANTFVNVAAIHLINDKGYEIEQKQLWTVGTEIQVPFEYRDRVMTLRIMPKSQNVNLTISDSGDRWIQRTE
jgi:hypothetical protein